MDKHKYMDKCMSLLTTKHFKDVDSVPQKSFTKLKSKAPPYEYKKLYPSGSYAGKFYGTAVT